MLRSMYSGVSGMRGFQTKLDVIGNNIANVNTVGFKAGRVMFKDILSQSMSGVTASVEGEQGGVNAKQIGLGVTVAAIDTLHTPGSAMTTSKPTDLRIDGDGFFAVSPGGDGETMYLTRAGNFDLDANRQLVNADGMFVLDSGGGIIQLDAEVTAFSISQTGEIIAIGADGLAEPTGIFIAVTVVSNPGGLEKVGGNLYRMTPNANPEGELELGQAADPETGSGSIISGQLEMSNVDLTNEFTEMIVAQRGFQSNSRIITTSDEILQEVVNLKR
ncbi:flagellar basal body rod protein FlgG [Cohnella sp. CIP 111063]|jgi:fagellar hook-basal body proteins|uniref:flagellar basal body rod protein FlgG n=1 Tax=unclassified Cohnella TaxID=2636738 RepID=UPI000B8BEB2F|nr:MULTISPECIES: flagellar basal body rod protein FlgG [unclassified Cohnella]OXS59679.1 flagellar basal body rod protein FlgG [Cohnella sp. CIP 111063]PRX72469.1 flagellar hook protein FlgE [Cohnella sp. SGD-V74]